MYYLPNLRWWNALLAVVGFLIMMSSHRIDAALTLRAAHGSTSDSYRIPSELHRQSRIANFRSLGGIMFGVGLLWTLAPFSVTRARVDYADRSHSENTDNI